MFHKYGNTVVTTLNDGTICTYFHGNDNPKISCFDFRAEDILLGPCLSNSVMLFLTIDHKFIVYIKDNKIDITDLIQEYIDCKDIIGIEFFSLYNETQKFIVYTSETVHIYKTDILAIK